MNEKYLILFIIIVIFIIYKCSSTRENMAMVTASTYLKGEDIKEIYDLTSDELENIPTIDNKIIKLIKDEIKSKDEVEDEVGDEDEVEDEVEDEDEKEIIKQLDPLWEQKRIPPKSILKILQIRLKECGVDKLNLNLKDITGLNNRKKFVQIIPILRNDIKNNINYDQIKCFMSRYDQNNFINIVQVQSKLPKYLPYNNLIMINTFLYHFTPYGVLKYNLLSNKKIDSENNVVVASMESSMINDINKYNDSSHIIIPLKGKLYRIKNGQFYNIKTGDNVDIIAIIKRNNEMYLKQLKKKKINAERQLILKDETDEEDETYYKFYDEYIQYKNMYLNLKNKLEEKDREVEEEIEEEEIEEEELEEEEINKTKLENIKKILIAKKAEIPEEYFKRTIYVINHSKDMYIIKPTLVIPNRGLGKSINDMIKKYNIVIKGVMPHFYNDVNNKFHVEYLFLCDSNFYFRFSDGQLSKLLDFKKDYNFSFTKNLKYELSCLEHKTILNQLVQTNKISISRKNKILNKMKCFNDDSMPIGTECNKD